MNQYEQMMYKAMSQISANPYHGLNACQCSWSDSVLGLSQYAIGPYTGWYDKDNERYRKGQPTAIRREYDWREVARLNPKFFK